MNIRTELHAGSTSSVHSKPKARTYVYSSSSTHMVVWVLLFLLLLTYDPRRLGVDECVEMLQSVYVMVSLWFSGELL